MKLPAIGSQSSTGKAHSVSSAARSSPATRRPSAAPSTCAARLAADSPCRGGAGHRAAQPVSPRGRAAQGVTPRPPDGSRTLHRLPQPTIARAIRRSNRRLSDKASAMAAEGPHRRSRCCLYRADDAWTSRSGSASWTSRSGSASSRFWPSSGCSSPSRSFAGEAPLASPARPPARRGCPGCVQLQLSESSF